MGVVITPFTEDRKEAVRQFNLRLAAGGVSEDFQFPESQIPYWLPKIDGRKIYQEYFLAVENDSVRGGYVLKYQDFSLSEEIRRLAYYHLPVSEGIVNKAYPAVGVQMIRNALETEPLLFALGMGGFDQPLPQMFRALGWSLAPIPFYFKVNHPGRFLANIRALRKTRWKRWLMDLGAVTGSGWLGVKALQYARQRCQLQKHSIAFEEVKEFGTWADELWRRCHTQYAMIAVRDREDLNILYPAGSERFLPLKVMLDSVVIGWAVVLDTKMQDHKQFGNLRVGSLVDCLASPENASVVVEAATRMLEKRGVELIVSNQSHTSWGQALKDVGYFAGPSNFIFAASKKLTETLAPFAVTQAHIHLNRGDGDGPIHL